MTSSEGVDADGYIITEVSRARVPARYEALLVEATELLKARFPNALHSLYLYGSVATGKAVEGSSDLDLLVVLTSPLGETELVAISRIAGEVSEKWRSLVREVGIEAVGLQEVMGQENPVGWGCFLKHLCICLEGEDLTQRFGRFRPGREVAWGFNGDDSGRLEQIERRLAVTDDGEVVAKLCASVSRRLVRVGFGLVMAEERIWTTDLTRSCELFCERYPAQAVGMRHALGWTSAPSSSKKEILDFLGGEFVAWLLEEFGRTAGPQEC